MANAAFTSTNNGHLFDQVILTLANNETIKRNLEQVSTGQVPCNPVIRELAQAVLEEIQLARKRRKIGLWISLGFMVIMIIMIFVIFVIAVPRH